MPIYANLFNWMDEFIWISEFILTGGHLKVEFLSVSVSQMYLIYNKIKDLWL